VRNNLALFVDFRYQNSIHWKLYLIKPETVVIGSANFTSTGLSLVRDTCIVIEDERLLNNYMTELELIKESINVIGQHMQEFHINLRNYKESHRRMQAALARAARARDANEWLEDEANQLIPLYIWDIPLTEDIMDIAHGLLAEDYAEGLDAGIRDIFTYESDNGDLPYRQGDIVLCMKNNGAHIDFYSFDRIIHHHGLSYIFSYRQNRYMRPFRLDPEIKVNIRRMTNAWWENGVTELTRSEIAELCR
jgi:hypothetical protein